MLAFRLIPLAALLISACQSAQQPAPDTALHGWLSDIQQQVSSRFDRAKRYAGQHCDMTIGYDAQRGYQVLRTEGDEPLCLQAWQTFGTTTTLPPPPPNAPAQFMLSFHPQ
ncbi:cell envelope integrity TolA C-terminal domain-containing protein [Mixta intestinalis]|jgi:membrane protein involved in colicin uptake|uniref:Uncharacterized protein n=1 Tax=Mixta intestinalis TaxID=1615494 RepID=A0A6P1PVL7_9GAMM|nr:cell envelope integrity TolA C-terminal domain-containing protein [Mixta intestinalis]QHM70102.1 hypothetical protein C7M51_00362 [Mixta intestinalis]